MKFSVAPTCLLIFYIFLGECWFYLVFSFYIGENKGIKPNGTKGPFPAPQFNSTTIINAKDTETKLMLG